MLGGGARQGYKSRDIRTESGEILRLSFSKFHWGRGKLLLSRHHCFRGFGLVSGGMCFVGQDS